MHHTMCECEANGSHKSSGLSKNAHLTCTQLCRGSNMMCCMHKGDKSVVFCMQHARLSACLGAQLKHVRNPSQTGRLVSHSYVREVSCQIRAG